MVSQNLNPGFLGSLGVVGGGTPSRELIQLRLDLLTRMAQNGQQIDLNELIELQLRLDQFDATAASNPGFFNPPIPQGGTRPLPTNLPQGGFTNPQLDPNAPIPPQSQFSLAQQSLGGGGFSPGLSNPNVPVTPQSQLSLAQQALGPGAGFTNPQLDPNAPFLRSGGGGFAQPSFNPSLPTPPQSQLSLAQQAVGPGAGFTNPPIPQGGTRPIVPAPSSLPPLPPGPGFDQRQLVNQGFTNPQLNPNVPRPPTPQQDLAQQAVGPGAGFTNPSIPQGQVRPIGGIPIPPGGGGFTNPQFDPNVPFRGGGGGLPLPPAPGQVGPIPGPVPPVSSGRPQPQPVVDGGFSQPSFNPNGPRPPTSQAELAASRLPQTSQNLNPFSGQGNFTNPQFDGNVPILRSQGRGEVSSPSFNPLLPVPPQSQASLAQQALSPRAGFTNPQFDPNVPFRGGGGFTPPVPLPKTLLPAASES